MLSQSCIFRESKNFTSSPGIWMPPTVPVDHYTSSRTKTKQNCECDEERRTPLHTLWCPIPLSHANVFSGKIIRLLWTLYFSQSKIRKDGIYRKVISHPHQETQDLVKDRAKPGLRLEEAPFRETTIADRWKKRQRGLNTSHNTGDPKTKPNKSTLNNQPKASQTRQKCQNLTPKPHS